MRYVTSILRAVYWVAVAVLPLFLHRAALEAMTDGGCGVGSECFHWSEPLMAQVGLVGIAARTLLWPLAAWNLGGRWLWKRWRAPRHATSINP